MSKTSILLCFSTSLLLLGAGCSQLGEEAARPLTVPLEALSQAQQLSADLETRAYQQANVDATDVFIALVLTEGTADAGGHELGTAFGCNDRIAYVKLMRPLPTKEIVSDALNLLFGLKQTEFDGLYTALAGSALYVEKTELQDDGTLAVWIKGKVVSGGACDDPRLKMQIEQTIARYIKKYRIYLNGSESAYRCLGDQSGSCE